MFEILFQLEEFFVQCNNCSMVMSFNFIVSTPLAKDEVIVKCHKCKTVYHATIAVDLKLTRLVREIPDG